MKERFDQMVEFTGCNPDILGLVFKTGPLKTIKMDDAKRLLVHAIDKFPYTQEINGTTRGFILAVGNLRAFSNFNISDENFEYVKFEYNPEEKKHE